MKHQPATSRAIAHDYLMSMLDSMPHRRSEIMATLNAMNEYDDRQQLSSNKPQWWIQKDFGPAKAKAD